MLIGIVEDDVHCLELLKIKLDAYKQEEDEIRCYRDSQSFDYELINQKLEFDILDKYFPQAIKKAKENINHLKSQYLYISWNKQKNEVYQKDIIYIERKSRVSYIYTKKEVYKTS